MAYTSKVSDTLRYTVSHIKNSFTFLKIYTMKKTIVSLCFLFVTGMLYAQTEKPVVAAAAAPKTRIVEASCGECNFGMKHTGCALAVKIDGKPYLVTGTPGLDSFGDAHAATGMCTVVRKAEVAGEIKDGKFAATTFKLLPVEAKP